MEKMNILNKNSVSTSGLIFQGMGQLSPIGIFGGSILGAAAFALGATPLSFIIGLLASLLAGNSIYQYSKKMASARGYYGYVGNGMGKVAGGYISYLYVFYQLANLSFIF
jgi:amino acid transporter